MTPVNRHDATEHLLDEVTVLSRRTRQKLLRSAGNFDPAIGLNGVAVVYALAAMGQCRQTELIDVLAVDKAVLSRTVSDLVAMGLVVREPDPTDARAHLISLSASGERQVAQIRDARRAEFEERMDHWAVEDVETLATLLGRYNQTWAE